MAILEVLHVWSGKTAGIVESGVRSYNRIFRVRLDRHNAGGLEATNMNGWGGMIIPGLNFPYVNPENGEADFGASCRSVTPTQDVENPFFWNVVCTFSSARTQIGGFSSDPHQFSTGGTQTGDPSEIDPLLRAPLIDWRRGELTRVMDKDFSVPPKACVSTNGQRFDSPIERLLKFRILHIEKNRISDQQSFGDSHVDRVNDAAWSIAGLSVQPKMALMKVLDASRQIEQLQFFWKVVYEFWIMSPSELAHDGQPIGWDDERLAVGIWALYFEPITSKLEKADITDKNGMPVTSPVPLDADGAELDLTGLPGTQPAYHYPRFTKHKTADMTALLI